ncbi:HAAS signaling domain-containing protein [Actinomadura sp. 3N508]|uniref:HAAS signaling domain-containing protein n=1 Tax=Actinomadura sp. 3N508 TaxID=3375153 RepID=UPI003795B6E1
MTTAYFDELAGRLRDSGVPEDEVTETVDDLAAYVAESGADPGDEFGTPEEFAARLVTFVDDRVVFMRPEAASPDADAALGKSPRAPATRLLASRRFYLFISCYFGFWIAVCVAWVAFAPAESRSRFLVGSLVGLVTAAVVAGVTIWRGARRGG